MTGIEIFILVGILLLAFGIFFTALKFFIFIAGIMMIALGIFQFDYKMILIGLLIYYVFTTRK
ncbi:MAG: hypothetical protein C0601_06645 [Candidatus Muiribacterium halophilum]|uniref:Uncharacterized protein n=1 Tax=Muiribacterium halophilum TaxID=2053465 RepID=A0A2N5ZGF6_MUIH1|nr:MAG: hypothetical protein C0601_06645 [Candidatus Muirbacterium halophilum]